MFQIFLKTALRNLLKNKLQSSINIGGLAIGLAAVLYIAAYLHNELSYDVFHHKKEKLFRVGVSTYHEGKVLSDGHIYTAPIGPAMKAEIPGVRNYTRYRAPREAYFSNSEKSLKTKEVVFADSTFFDVFSFELLEGNATKALAAPGNLVLSKSTAERLFGKSDPMGESVYLNNETALIVTGIAADVPANSHLKFNALISFSTLYQSPTNKMGWDGGNQYVTYVELDENAHITDVEAQLPTFMWKHINEEYSTMQWKDEVGLQPLPDVHLNHNPYSVNLQRNLYFLGGIALLLVVLACINFVNLSTAMTGRRAKEVGVRKVLGASKRSLVSQFFGETFLLSTIAFAFALILAELALPFLPDLFGKPIDLPSIFQWQTLCGLFALLLLTGLGAGLYPSIFLASVDSVNSLKGYHQKPKRRGFRGSLVVFQFAVSIAFMVSTLVISNQLDFTQNQSLGFEKENILVVPLVGEEVQTKVGTLKQELLNHPEVAMAAACSQVPGDGFTQNGYVPEGMSEPVLMNVVDVDDNFFELFELPLVEGRTLSRNKPADRQLFMVNEALVRQMEWANPIGKTIERNTKHEIVGVVKDFHFASLHESIQPLIFTCSPWKDKFNFLAIKLTPGNLSKKVQAIGETWGDVIPDTPLEHWFLDDNIEQVYQSEQHLRQAFAWGGGLSIFIALMGVFGLTTFMVEQRVKEIGIRKVLGASTIGLVGMLSKDFLKLVTIAIVIASPAAWFFMNNWLQGFAYRVSISWEVFALAGLTAIVVAFLTVSLQSIKASLANPVESLRSE